MRTEGKVIAVLVYNLEIQSLASSAALLACKQTECRQGKSPKETLPGCSSSPIAAVVCAVYFLVMRAARKVLVFLCFVSLRARFSGGEDLALLH